MSKPILIVILAAVLSPALPAQHMSVAQLREMLAAQKSAHKSDRDIAQKTGAAELSERLTPATFDQLKSELQPGPKTIEALELQSDVSGFLDPPAAELPVKDAPDAAAQSQLLRQAIEFAAITMHRMPDFVATRTTRSFDDRPLIASPTGWTPAQTNLHLAGTFTRQITYRDGREVPEDLTSRQVSRADVSASPSGLITSGEFGPALATVITDAPPGHMTWSHWEQTAAGVAAVFRFQVPEEASHYSVSFCSVTQSRLSSYRHINDSADADTHCDQGTPAYHGSLTIDPATGAILRIAIESDLPRSDAMARAAISVLYGSVEIGGRTYVCPVHSVAISLFRFPESSPPRNTLRVNDATFTDYHRFGATVRVVPAH